MKGRPGHRRLSGVATARGGDPTCNRRRRNDIQCQRINKRARNVRLPASPHDRRGAACEDGIHRRPPAARDLLRAWRQRDSLERDPRGNRTGSRETAVGVPASPQGRTAIGQLTRSIMRGDPAGQRRCPALFGLPGIWWPAARRQRVPRRGEGHADRPAWFEGHPLSQAANQLISSMVRKIGHRPERSLAPASAGRRERAQQPAPASPQRPCPSRTIRRPASLRESVGVATLTRTRRSDTGSVFHVPPTLAAHSGSRATAAASDRHAAGGVRNPV
jgi:hypothetical protein